MKLQYKFFLALSALTALILGIVGASFIAVERNILIDEAQKRKQAALESLAGIFRESHVTRDILLATNYLKLMKQSHPEVGWASAVDSEGTIQAALSAELIGAARKTIAADANFDWLKKEVSLGAQPLGYVEIGFDQRRVQQNIENALSNLLRRLAVIGLAALVLGFLMAWLLARSLSRPISALAEAAKLLGQGKLGIQTQLKSSGEIGALADSFNAMSRELQEFDQIKKDFVSSTTHELRSPLAAIESHAGLLLDDLDLSADFPSELKPDWTSSLRHIKNSAGSLMRLINDLLDIAKIERGKMDFRFEMVSPSAIISEVLAFMEPKAKEMGITLSSRLAANLPELKADPQRLHQVLINLIANALKFTPAGGKIEIATDLSGPKEIRISVADTGAGIPKEFLPRLFGKFEQAAGARDHHGPKGTGLGLAICKGIVEAHAGTIGALSKEGQGTTMYFTLPAGNGSGGKNV